MVPPSAEDLRFKTRSDGYVHVHPSSTIAKNPSIVSDSPYYVFNEKIKTSRVFVRDLTMVPIYPMILFGGGDQVEVELQRGQFVVSLEGGWIKVVTATQSIAEFLQRMRFELDQILVDKFANPKLDLATDPRKKLIIDAIVSVISIE